jgi:predicted nucleotidyltransferase component of viral defense system
MIKEHCFTDEWLESFKQGTEYNRIDKIILEKMIYAFHLLESLQNNKLEFVFKGGTSLVLLLEENRRFSIDIDIISLTKKEALEKIFDKLIQSSKFIKWELQEHRSYKEGVPKAHYKFFYDSDNWGSGTILLDILIEKSLYPDHVEIPINTKWIEVDEETLVRVPSIDCITGDKLTAFAPNTIGIPYTKSGKSTTMEICKQLFDLSMLFEKIQNFKTVSTTYRKFAEKEIEYRESGLKISNTLIDTIETCLIIAKRGMGTPDEQMKFKELQKGIKSFGTGYLMSGVFRIDNAISAASRVAYLATKILKNDLSPIEYFEKEDISGMEINDPQWGFISRLRKLPDKTTFYYFYKAYQLIVDPLRSSEPLA